MISVDAQNKYIGNIQSEMIEIKIILILLAGISHSCFSTNIRQAPVRWQALIWALDTEKRSLHSRNFYPSGKDSNKQ